MSDAIQKAAAEMLPKYLEWKKSLPWIKQGHSMVGIRDWVMQEMRAYESYPVIDAVGQALIELVMPDKAP